MLITITGPDGDLIDRKDVDVSDDDLLRIYSSALKRNTTVNKDNLSFTVDPLHEDQYTEVLLHLLLATRWSHSSVVATGNVITMSVAHRDRYVRMVVRRLHHAWVSAYKFHAPRYTAIRTTVERLWDVLDIKDKVPGDLNDCIQHLIDILNILKAGYIKSDDWDEDESD